MSKVNLTHSFGISMTNNLNKCASQYNVLVWLLLLGCVMLKVSLYKYSKNINMGYIFENTYKEFTEAPSVSESVISWGAEGKVSLIVVVKVGSMK